MCQQEIPQTQKALSYHMLVKHGFDLEDYYEYCVISNRPEELRSQASEPKENYPVELVEGYDTWKNKCVWRCAKCPNFSARLEAGQAVYLFFADAKVQTAGLSSSWLAIFKCRRGSAVTLLGISKCRRGSADRGWLFLSADAKVQTLALSLSSLDYAHISSSDTFRF